MVIYCFDLVFFFKAHLEKETKNICEYIVYCNISIEVFSIFFGWLLQMEYFDCFRNIDIFALLLGLVAL